jgi:DNA modification methylase
MQLRLNRNDIPEHLIKYFKPIKSHQPKSMCLIPERFAIGMVERGWLLRNSIIWAKPNHMPESVTDRLTKAHEVVYHFVKQGKYYYNLDAIREPHTTESIERYKRSVQLGANAVQGKILQREEQNLGYPRHAPKWFIEGQDAESFGSPRARTQRTKYNEPGNKNAGSLTDSRDYYRNNGLAEGNQNGKNPGDVWTITTQPYPEGHFAVFPLELVRRPILAGCPKRVKAWRCKCCDKIYYTKPEQHKPI